ncbi:hypothetical protein ADL34_30430 [Streptomyces sp. NRRL WC-3605]|nr:hypothetical protein ADL34_30430 [Streptomyces sp. NRRL WC-3605]KUL70726.1 hypothetical protein ADL33_28075 [Streptomyces sp. NRRL WC-3604]
MDQAASDLEDNRRRQRELTEQLTVLRQEEALLTDILKLAQRYEGFADPSRLPEQSQDEPVAARTKRTSAAAERRPLLGDLLLELLREHDQPRLAKELRDELLAKHPDRQPTPQVVRNTLESLVAKGRIRRHKRQRSVMYTLSPSETAA